MGFFGKKIVRKRLAVFLEKHKTNKKVLDVGGSRGAYQKFFPHQVVLDIEDLPEVDIVADAHDMHMIEDESFEVVLCTSVLEHCKNPWKVVSEIHRILKKGGKLILSVPFCYPLHCVPNDYWRFTKFGIQELLKDFTSVKIQEDLTALESVGYTFHRLFMQTSTFLGYVGNLFFFLLGKFFHFFPSGFIRKQYANVDKKKTIGESLLTSNYLVVARK